ncbi:MAG: hypothetical protein J0H55_05045 [Chitinophagaceae bacterium]|nr:hypothetical protein [Chitinophagaceae bacterium]
MKIETVNIQEVSGEQIISLPRGLRLNDNKVYLKKSGEVIYIIPFHKPWDSLFESLQDFSDDFMKDRDQPSFQNRESFD